jgi:hypothetical protein
VVPENSDETDCSFFHLAPFIRTTGTPVDVGRISQRNDKRRKIHRKGNEVEESDPQNWAGPSTKRKVGHDDHQHGQDSLPSEGLGGESGYSDEEEDDCDFPSERAVVETKGKSEGKD